MLCCLYCCLYVNHVRTHFVFIPSINFVYCLLLRRYKRKGDKNGNKRFRYTCYSRRFPLPCLLLLHTSMPAFDYVRRCICGVADGRASWLAVQYCFLCFFVIQLRFFLFYCTYKIQLTALSLGRRAYTCT